MYPNNRAINLASKFNLHKASNKLPIIINCHNGHSSDNRLFGSIDRLYWTRQSIDAQQLSWDTSTLEA